MAIILNDNIEASTNKPLESLRGPYSGSDEAAAKAAACAAVLGGSTGVRYVGRQVDLVFGGSSAVYVWESGIADADLVPLTTPLPQALGTGDSPTFSGLALTGTNPLVVNKTTATSDAPIIATQVGIPDFTVIDVLQAGIKNTDGNTVNWKFRGASVASGNPSYDVILYLPQYTGGYLALTSDITAALATTLNITPTQAAALTAGQTYFASIVKSAIDGSIALNTSVKSISIFAPSTVNSLLLDPSGWGNVVGQGSEYNKLTGDNTTGALGNRGQICVLNGDTYVCIDHVTGTGSGDGSATWARNRSLNFLDETMDAALITELTTEAGWNSDQFKSTTNVSNKGRTYAGLTGYMYICIDVNSWRRYQISIGGKPMQITSTSNPNLTTNLAAHDFSTGNYIEVSGDETAYQGQEYWVAGYIYRRGSTAQGWARIKTND